MANKDNRAWCVDVRLQLTTLQHSLSSGNEQQLPVVTSRRRSNCSYHQDNQSINQSEIFEVA